MTDYPSTVTIPQVTRRGGFSVPLEMGQSKVMAHSDAKPRKRPKSETRQRQIMLAARVNADEERRIRQAAKAQGVSVASLIRSAVLAVTERSPA
jgi:hypothetical protein